MWYNPLVSWLLRSPLHRLMDGNTILLTYTGQKSGQPHTLPISYAQTGLRLRLITRRQKRWWKNVAAGARVSVWMRGRPRHGWASVPSTDPTERMEAILAVYRGIPQRLAERQVAEAVVVTIDLEPVPAAAPAFSSH
jgi:hypothetical protein